MVVAVAVSDNGYSTKFPTVPLRLPREHEQLFRDLIVVYRHLYERGETARLMDAVADAVYSVQCDGSPVVLRPEEREAVGRREAEAAKARELAQVEAEERARELEQRQQAILEVVKEQTEALRRAEEAERQAREAAEAEAMAKAKIEAELEQLRNVAPGAIKELTRLQKVHETLSHDYAVVASEKMSLEDKLAICQQKEKAAREAAKAECDANAKAKLELEKLTKNFDIRLAACQYKCDQLFQDLEFEKALRIDVQAREAELEQRIAELEKENKKLRAQLEKLPVKPRSSRAKKAIE